MTTVLFACVHNAGRSQMAAALFNTCANPAKARAISAGTAPGERVHPEVVESTPGIVADTVNAYLAFRAALRAVLAHNRSGAPPIRSLLCPGLGTAVGRIPVARCARQMRVAWDRVLGQQSFTPASVRQAAADELALLR
jgi:hypothetical protein